MENTRVITLGPSQSIESVSFEDAFGEHSEFKGRGRDRRAKRKKDRQEKRQEKKMRKITQRGERKATKQEQRQLRKDTRKSRRVTRKAMGDEVEPIEESKAQTEVAELEQPTPVEQSEQSQSIQETQGGGESQDGGGQTQGGGGGQEEWGGGKSTSQEEEEEGEEGEEEDDEEEGDDEGEGDDSGFDGTMNSEDKHGEMAKTISPKVKDLTNKIQWHKELIARLKNQRESLIAQGNSGGKIDNTIRKSIVRINELESMLAGYSGADGGRHSGRREKEIKRGREFARNEYRLRRSKNRNGGSETPVKSDLNPEFSEQKIVVPANSNAQGPYANPEDLVNDFDAPEMKIELGSSAEGVKNKLSLKHVAIGVGIAVIGIIAYNKLKK